MAEGKSYRVAGFEVHFPHEAYGVQKVFINQVLKAIHNEENALLEAPTGCGKTLSLLCGALAWQHAQKQKKAAAEQLRKERREAEAADAKPGTCLAPVKQNSKGPGEATSDVDEPEEPEEEIRVPKIYYATRTHSQIAQVRQLPGQLITEPVMVSTACTVMLALVVESGKQDCLCGWQHQFVHHP